jgi:hypothetical protein
MPIHNAERWLQKAADLRVAAEKMSTNAAKDAMLEIARLYRQLAEQARRLEEQKAIDE